jgi:hypothetical protein
MPIRRQQQQDEKGSPHQHFNLNLIIGTLDLYINISISAANSQAERKLQFTWVAKVYLVTQRRHGV